MIMTTNEEITVGYGNKAFFVYTPFTGLGLYGGFRGNRWLRNRITIFKEFVIPSLLNQTDRNFVHWISWRPEERTNKYVIELQKWMNQIPNYRFVFTYEGIVLWDDKFDDKVAREKLFNSLHRTLPWLFDYAGDCDEVYWLLQPSDDLYDRMTVQSVREAFMDKKMQAVAYTKGYLCNYNTKEVLEYNPKTSPPFHAIKFPHKVFFDPGKHMTYISLKEDMNQYKKGTPCPSHEYLEKCLNTAYFEGRGFLVGTHGENISTHFNHPYGGDRVDKRVLQNFGVYEVPPIKLPLSLRKWVMRRLPYRWQRKLRYIFGEMFASKIYEWIRS